MGKPIELHLPRLVRGPVQVRTTLAYCTIPHTDYSHTESRWKVFLSTPAVWPQQVRTTLPYCTILRTDYSHTESRWSFVFWRAQNSIPVINQKGVFSFFPRRSPAIMMILGVLVSTYRPQVSNCVPLEYSLYSNDALNVWVLYQRYL